MNFDPALMHGVLLRRYKRFLADVRLDGGGEVTAHCANPGSMMGLAEPGRGVWLSRSDNPKRKLAHTLELIEDGGALVGVHTGRANAVVAEALRHRRIAELADYGDIRPEVKVGGHSRLDFQLTGEDGRRCFLEVKSVTLRRDHDAAPGLAEFPDAATRRGAKHLGVLAGLVRGGDRAVMLYLVQRSDCDRFAPAADIDPDYAEAAVQARGQGVEILCYACRITPTELVLERPLPVEG